MIGLSVHDARRTLRRPIFGNPFHIESLRTLRLAWDLRRARKWAQRSLGARLNATSFGRIRFMTAEQITAELKAWRHAGFNPEAESEPAQ